MWKKGAVVIVKHGDEAMANAMASVFDEKKDEDIEVNEDPNYDKTWKDLLYKSKKDAIDAAILDAKEHYEHNWTPPKWAKRIVECFALVVYGVCVFIDKYLVIREEKEK